MIHLVLVSKPTCLFCHILPKTTDLPGTLILKIISSLCSADWDFYLMSTPETLSISLIQGAGVSAQYPLCVILILIAGLPSHQSLPMGPPDHLTVLYGLSF